MPEVESVTHVLVHLLPMSPVCTATTGKYPAPWTTVTTSVPGNSLTSIDAMPFLQVAEPVVDRRTVIGS